MPHPLPTPSRVQRYDGSDLGPSPHIAVLGSCKVGNFVATLPLLGALRRRYPQARVDFWGSDATADFEHALCAGQGALLNWRISWDQGSPEAFGQLAAAAVERGAPDLVVNTDGFNPLTQVLASWLRPTWVAGGAVTANGRRELPWGDHSFQRFLADRDWDSLAFLERYKGQFRSNYIGELLCRLAFLDPTPEELAQTALPWVDPPFAVPPLLIHCTTTRAAKIWSFARWAEVLHWCAKRAIQVGLVGAAAARQVEEYHAGCGEEQLLAGFGSAGGGPLIDLRGRTSLIELGGACRAAKAVVSVDAGPLHIAAAVGVPVMAVVGNDGEGVGASPIRLWLPRAPQLARTVSTAHCDGCTAEHFLNDGCVAERHHCMEGVDAAQVINWLEQVMS